MATKHASAILSRRLHYRHCSSLPGILRTNETITNNSPLLLRTTCDLNRVRNNNTFLASYYNAVCKREISTATIGDEASAAESNATSNEDYNNTNVDRHRRMILQTSLKEIHEHGWTDDAIAAAVVDVLALPPSMIGLITPEDLISYFMDECNNKLNNEIHSSLLPLWNNNLQQNEEKNHGDDATFENSNNNQRAHVDSTSTIIPISQRIESCVRTRLEYVIPYVRSNRWSEGMAIGATKVPTTTTRQLNDLMSIISNSVITGTDHKPLTSIEHMTIAGIYVSTELHLLADDSPNYDNTWIFLHERCKNELQTITNCNLQSPNIAMNSDTLIAASAVASSLGSAVVSLAQPAARNVISSAASTIILPTLTSFMQQQSSNGTSGATNYQEGRSNVSPPSNMAGTKPSDY